MRQMNWEARDNLEVVTNIQPVVAFLLASTLQEIYCFNIDKT